MQRPLILWSDFTANAGTTLPCAGFASRCRIHYNADPQTLAQRIARLRPDIVCFDFDRPATAGLAILRETRQRHPSIPVLLFTADDSQDLLIRALRLRVWDCFIKPVDRQEILQRLDVLLDVLRQRGLQTPRTLLLPAEAPADALSHAREIRAPTRTAAALPYIREHYHEKITLHQVAQLCSMTLFDFSRTFRREQGITFRDYLTGVRIRAAAGILRTTGASVIDVACAVGINDHSQFTRLFRRLTGVTPSAYRNGRSRPGPDFPPATPPITANAPHEPQQRPYIENRDII